MISKIDVNKINKKIANFKSSPKLELNCPRLVNDLMKTMNNLLEISYSPQELKQKKYDMIIKYKVLTQANHIESEEIKENIVKFEEILEEKKLQAITEGKKLLILLGENHNLQISTFYEMIFATVLKNQGFSSVLVEGSKKSLKTFHHDIDKISSQMSWKFMEKILDMNLTPIDPYHHLGDLGWLRCQSINNAISKNDSENQIAIVGARHLSHIVNSPEVNSKFIIFPVDVSMSYHRYPPEVYNAVSAAKINEWEKDVPQEALRPVFTSLIESFSLNKLFEIYTDLLPAIIHQIPFPEDTIYNSDFSEDHSICRMFDHMLTVDQMEMITLEINKYYSEHEL